MRYLGSLEDLKIQSNHKTVSSLDVSEDFKRGASVSVWIYPYIVGDTPLLGGFPSVKVLT